MKKFVFLMAITGMALGFNACKKDNNDGGNPNPSTTSCSLISLVNKTTATAGGTSYDGFYMTYDGDKISRANFADSTTGNEDKNNYALFSYNSGNLSDMKIYQAGQLALDISFTYNANNKVATRHFNLNTQLGTGTVDQTFYYDNNGHLSYSVQNFSLDLGTLGKIENKDSGLYSDYNSFGRPGKIVVYRSTHSPQGDEPYAFSEELVYEYDSKGNRTKESSRSDLADPLEVQSTTTYDLDKTPGDADKAYRLLSKIDFDTWADPNLDTKDINGNLEISTSENDGNGGMVITTTTYTLNDRKSPATSKAVDTDQTVETTYTYSCK